ncbi:hypothetical protein ACXGQW_06550 [Wenyingzhuangia sp. IMCC45533]
MKNYSQKINQYIERKLLNYIDKLTRSFYPKEINIESEYRDAEDDEDPILFL